MPSIKTIKFLACVTHIFAPAGSFLCLWIDNLKTPQQTLICATAHIHIPVYPHGPCIPLCNRSKWQPTFHLANLKQVPVLAAQTSYANNNRFSPKSLLGDTRSQHPTHHVNEHQSRVISLAYPHPNTISVPSCVTPLQNR